LTVAPSVPRICPSSPWDRMATMIRPSSKLTQDSAKDFVFSTIPPALRSGWIST
jgi:hypothetical protein